MNIGIFVNRRSGRNKAGPLAQRCEQLLSERSHTVSLCTPEQAADSGYIDQFLEPLDRLVIVGGDGSVHHMLPNLIKRELPFFHLATGTSNLISKELKMPKDPEQAISWIEDGGVNKLDVPTIDGIPFLIMCSFGMDALVIHHFEGSRTRSGGFRNYVIPVFNTFFRPKGADVTLNIDGEPNQSIRGMNITIANMRSFALGINPCNKADPTDAQLDLLALTNRNSITWSLATWTSMLRLNPIGSQREQLKTLTITGGSVPTPVQVDGEIACSPHIESGMLMPGVAIGINVGQYHAYAVTAPE